jgi:septal ring factor EnvC (AmiA/AmiB activator)
MSTHVAREEGEPVSDKYVSASSTPSTTLRLPGQGRQGGKRRRNGLFASLVRAIAPRTDEKRSLVPAVMAVLLWVGLACAGYAFAVHTLDKQQQFVNQRIQEVQAQNEQQMRQLEEQLALVQDEMKQVQNGLANLQEDLQLTGETIGGTNKTKQALQDRIDQLNKQLVELKASLKKLEDAARAW